MKAGCFLYNHALAQAEARLRWHRRFDGLYARTAKQLGVDPSFVSKVASGTRNSEKVTQALEAEMKRLQKLKPR
jgi:hypothetical protein